MTEQPPSAEAMTLLIEIIGSCGQAGLCRFLPCACAESIDALIAQRVSAETDKLNAIIKYFVPDWREATYHCPPDPLARCSRCDTEDVLPTYCGHGEKASAPAERSAPPLEKPECHHHRLTPNCPYCNPPEDLPRRIGVQQPTQHTGQPGCGNRWLPIETAPKDGTRLLTWQPSGASPHEAILRRNLTRNLWLDDRDGWFVIAPTYWRPLPEPPVPSALASTGEQPASPATVVDYTERAGGIVRQWVADEHRELRMIGKSQDNLPGLVNRVANALSAVASEHQAEIASMRSLLDTVYECERTLIAERDAALAKLARLQEPDVKAAVRSAIANVKEWVPSYRGQLLELADRLADAAIARIEEMLTP